MIIDGKTFIPVSVASKMLKVTTQRVRQLVHQKRISSRRLENGWIWVCQADVKVLMKVSNIDTNTEEEAQEIGDSNNVS